MVVGDNDKKFQRPPPAPARARPAPEVAPTAAPAPVPTDALAPVPAVALAAADVLADVHPIPHRPPHLFFSDRHCNLWQKAGEKPCRLSADTCGYLRIPADTCG